ncbi:unnamed protein product [Brachionus calyciflorus]|uniref:Uncharacterized protein n=1 Tax=Brachionus calyciflorus TaxID=104777 RepID=A0A813RNF9_9BILA|nr:unnamed protein product [Brachionus calyciflorus]
MATRRNVLTCADEVLLSLAQLESIKDELKNNKNPSKLIKEANKHLESAKLNLSKIQFKCPKKDFDQFQQKYIVLNEFFKKYEQGNSNKKFNYDDQPAIDSFNMDELTSQQTSRFKPFQDSQNASSLMSQSILNFDKKKADQFRSKSLSQKRISLPKTKKFKDPVCELVKSPKKSRPYSIAATDRIIETFTNTQKLPVSKSILPVESQARKSLKTQFLIPQNQASQDLSKAFEKPKKLNIRIIQDNELIPLASLPDNYWENISNGKIDLIKEFEKDFDF